MICRDSRENSDIHLFTSGSQWIINLAIAPKHLHNAEKSGSARFRLSQELGVIVAGFFF